MLNASTPSKPSTYLVNPMNASAMASPMPLSRKNRPYSRRMPVRARCRNVQCRFMKYELVAATTVDSALDVIGPIPRPTWKTFASPRSRTVLTTPMIPNLVNSWIRRCHCAYSRRRRLTRPIVRDDSVPPPGCHRTAIPPSLHQAQHAEQPVLLLRPADQRGGAAGQGHRAVVDVHPESVPFGRNRSVRLASAHVVPGCGADGELVVGQLGVALPGHHAGTRRPATGRRRQREPRRVRRRDRVEGVEHRDLAGRPAAAGAHDAPAPARVPAVRPPPRPP